MSTKGSFNPVFGGVEVPVIKSYSFTSRGIGAGIYYITGFYFASPTDANLTQASPVQLWGTANVSYEAHAFIVAGGPGSASGGVGPVEIEVSGTSMSDSGIRIPGDTEVIVADITTLSVNQFLETPKKWLGQPAYTVKNALGSTQTTFNVDFNYGLNKYEDFGNKDYILEDVECVGLAGATDTAFNIRVLKQDPNNWIYAPALFVPGGTELLNMNTIHGVENDIRNNEYFSFKRTGLTFPIKGSNSEGIVIEIDSGTNNSVESMDTHLGALVTL